MTLVRLNLEPLSCEKGFIGSLRVVNKLCCAMGADLSSVSSDIKTKGGGQPVTCACSPLKAFSELLPAAYHTSIAIGDIEFSFDSSGVTCSRVWLSHSMLSATTRNPEVVLQMGYTNVQAATLAEMMDPHFMPGTYDLLLKNCNAFSNAALFYLLGKQLDEKYTALDRAGALIDKKSGLVQLLLLGDYIPNPKAGDFELERVLTALQDGDRVTLV